VPRGPFWTLWSGLYTYNDSSSSACAIEQILKINRNAADSDRDTWVGTNRF